MSYDPDHDEKNLSHLMIVVFVATACFSALLTFVHFYFMPQ